jgi:hypothetical protein
MNYSDQLVEYIDGELTPEAEKELFSAIASDDSLREEMRTLMNMKNAISNSGNLYEPSSAMKGAIFSAVNIVPANAPVPIPENPGMMGKIANFNIKSMLTGGIITLLLISPFIYFYGKNYQNNGKEAKQNLSQIKAETPPVNIINSEIKNNSETVKPIIKYVYIVKEIPKELPNVISNSELEDIKEINIATATPQNYDQKFDLVQRNSNLGNELDIRPEHDLRISDQISVWKDLGLSLEIRNSASWNLPKETIYPSYLSKINNMGFSILYDLDKNIRVGADIRQETFFVRYNGTNNINQQLQYEQQPNLLSYGIILRYIMPEVLGIKPFIQGIASMNYYGLIGRGSIGLEYRFYPDFGLIAQAEYSNMRFQHQKNNFNSSKVNFTYGINYNF